MNRQAPMTICVPFHDLEMDRAAKKQFLLYTSREGDGYGNAAQPVHRRKNKLVW
jgi:hypothetical protein